MPATTETIERLKADQAKNATEQNAQSQQNRPRGSKCRGEARLDVGPYLEHYGVEYQKKQSDSGTLYTLKKCLFNPNHQPNEASIIQLADGKLLYQCFHDSCSDKRWGDARAIISGDDKLGEFMIGGPSGGSNAGRASQSGAQAKSVQDDEKLIHIDAAKQVAASFGEGNLITTSSGTYAWGVQPGIWERVEDLKLKTRIHQVVRHKNKLTRTSVASILDLLKTETFQDDVVFGEGPECINLQNGELHWNGQEWELRPHTRENYMTIQLPVDYDQDAEAPRFKQFLAEIFRDDPDAEAKAILVCEALGYTLLNTARFEKFFILIGAGANGKSVLLFVVESLVGKDQVAAVQPNQFDNRFQRAHLYGKLANIVSEIAEGAQVQDDFLKSVTSGEMTTVENKHSAPFNVKIYATCWFGGNHLPHTRDFSQALFRRASIIECNREFSEGEQDKGLKEKLARELPGILNLAIEAMAGVFLRGSFTAPESSESAKREWRLEADQVAQFVEEACVTGPGYEITSAKLYEAYKDWAKEAGINRTVGRNMFTKRVERLGFKKTRTAKARLFVGIALGDT